MTSINDYLKMNKMDSSCYQVFKNPDSRYWFFYILNEWNETSRDIDVEKQDWLCKDD